MIRSVEPRGTSRLTVPRAGQRRRCPARRRYSLASPIDLPFGEQRPRLEAVEAPIQQLLGLVGALLRALQPVDHDDQPQAVLHRRADQAVAGLLGEAGLHAVGADVHREQRIAVLLADLVPGELPLAVDRIELGIGA